MPRFRIAVATAPFRLPIKEAITAAARMGAEGVQFENGKCALAWLTDSPSIAVYDSLEDIEKIHGHQGETEIVWLPSACQPQPLNH